MPYSIRSLRPGDAAALADLLNNPKLQANLRDGLPLPYSLQDAEAFIEAMRTAPPEDCFSFAITEDDVLIGHLSIVRRGNIHRQTAELGYYIAESHWGRGIATRAVTMACRQAFSRSKIIRIFAEPFAKNAASCRVLEKAGFQLEGLMRCNAVKHGEILDVKLYSLLHPSVLSPRFLSARPADITDYQK